MLCRFEEQRERERERKEKEVGLKAVTVQEHKESLFSSIIHQAVSAFKHPWSTK